MVLDWLSKNLVYSVTLMDGLKAGESGQIERLNRTVKNDSNCHVLVIKDKNLAAKYKENWKEHRKHSEKYTAIAMPKGRSDEKTRTISGESGFA